MEHLIEDFSLTIEPPPSPPSWVNAPHAGLKKILDKAYRDALYDFYKHAFKSQMVANFMESGQIPITPDNDMQLKLLNEAKDRLITKSPYIFLTINPRDGVGLEEFKKQIEKFANRRIVRAYSYVYEIRSASYTGMHCHMLLHYTCKPYDFKRAAKSTFKNVCDVNNPAILNIRYVDSDALTDKLEYMSGKKQDKKLDSVKWTKEWRLKNKIQDIYASEQPLKTNVALLGCVETTD